MESYWAQIGILEVINSIIEGSELNAIFFWFIARYINLEDPFING